MICKNVSPLLFHTYNIMQTQKKNQRYSVVGDLGKNQHDLMILLNLRNVVYFWQVGSANTNQLQLFGPSIQSRHCLVSLLEGVCTVTPLHADALTFVNGHHIQQPTILHVSNKTISHLNGIFCQFEWFTC